MLKLLQRFTGRMLNMVSPAARRDQQAARKAQLQRRKEILLSELSQEKLSGKPVAYRRLDSLMLAAGTNSSRVVMLHRSISRVVVYFDTIYSPLMRLHFMCLILFK